MINAMFIEPVIDNDTAEFGIFLKQIALPGYDDVNALVLKSSIAYIWRLLSYLGNTSLAEGVSSMKLKYLMCYFADKSDFANPIAHILH